LLNGLAILEGRCALPAAEAVGLPVDLFNHSSSPRYEDMAFRVFDHLILIHGCPSTAYMPVLESSKRLSQQEVKYDKKP